MKTGEAQIFNQLEKIFCLGNPFFSFTTDHGTIKGTRDENLEKVSKLLAVEKFGGYPI